MKITSVNNELVKDTVKLQQKKYRDEKGLFLLEGEKCIEEAILPGIELEYVFVKEGYNKFNEFNPIETTDSVLAKISTTTSAPKCVAVGKQIKPEWNRNYTKVILLESIKDAGNLGTILRTACAFNIDAVILYGDTVDLYNPKCVRASVGNLWKVPVFRINELEELKSVTKSLKPIATLPKNSNSVWLKDFRENNNLLIMFGAESDGLSDELVKYSDECGKSITIEMSKNVESLNLSISAGVIMYNIFAQ